MSARPGEEKEFALTKVADDLYLCKEKYYKSWNVANQWIVKGTAMDLIIDTGIGLWDLPKFLKEQKVIGEEDKPYQAVATHVHFDHAGGLHQFKEFAIHREEAHAVESGDSYEACCFLSYCELGKRPSDEPEGWRSHRDYKLRSATPTRTLEDGDVFDLGDKQLKVLHLPGHSRGSIALYDEENGRLFSGDIVYDGPALDSLPFSNVEDNIRSYEKLKELAPRVKQVYPGHLGIIDGEKMGNITSNYLDKIGRCHDCTTFVAKRLLSCVLKGRNTNDPASKCCYYSCCCCLCT